MQTRKYKRWACAATAAAAAIAVACSGTFWMNRVQAIVCMRVCVDHVSPFAFLPIRVLAYTHTYGQMTKNTYGQAWCVSHSLSLILQNILNNNHNNNVHVNILSIQSVCGGTLNSFLSLLLLPPPPPSPSPFLWLGCASLVFVVVVVFIHFILCVI